MMGISWGVNEIIEPRSYTDLEWEQVSESKKHDIPYAACLFSSIYVENLAKLIADFLPTRPWHQIESACNAIFEVAKKSSDF